MFEKTLTDIVKGIRASKRDTALYISQCIAEIKTEINSSDMYVKANALQKLTFLHMMGYGMSWASFATIEVMSSPRFAHKRIGYLAASQGFTQDTDVILLTTNLLKKELKSSVGSSMNGVYEAGLAVNCVSNIVTEELAQDLLPELTNLTTHPQPYLRKKAILCLFKAFVKYPQGLRLTFAQIQQCLSDSNPAVVSCAVNVITELSDKNPRNYLHLAPAFFDLLTTSSNNWMLIKVVKLLGSLVPEEPRLARKLLEPLADIVRNTPAKSLLYESVHAITLCLPYCRKSDGSMPASVPEIVDLCAQTLRDFVEERDQNLKYLGLVGFGSLRQSHPKVLSAPNYRPLILACLSDEDVTIRTRALDLLPGMTSRKNLMELVTQLLQHVELASGTYKIELVSKIVEMCSGEKYAMVQNFSWYLDTLFQLGHMRGLDSLADLLRSQVTDVALRVLPVRVYAVKRSIEILLEGDQEGGTSMSEANLDDDNGRGKHIMPEILPALAWIIGEYSDLFADAISMDADAVYIYDNDSEGPYHSVVQAISEPSNSTKLPTSTQKVYVHAALKVFAAATANSAVSDDELEALAKTLSVNLQVYLQSTDVEVQERAFTCFNLLQSLGITSSGGPPGLVPIGQEADGDDDNDGSLLGTSLQKATTTMSSSSLAAKCKECAQVLNYVLKPSAMKPTSAKAQRKKKQTPMGQVVNTDSAADLDLFSSLIEEENLHRSSSRLSMETVSFTQQRPFRTQEHISIDAISSQDFPTAAKTTTGLGSDMGGVVGSIPTFQTSASSESPSMRLNPTYRPQTSSDPFYLNSGPSILDSAADGTGTNTGAGRFGAIELGDGDSEDDDDDHHQHDGGAGDKKKKKKKKKSKEKNQKVAGANSSTNIMGQIPGTFENITVYGSDDDNDYGLLRPQRRSGGRKANAEKEFHGLAKVDLTMPLRDDEVMPERKHRVVPERTPDAAPEINQVTPSKSKKKKKESKRSKKSLSSSSATPAPTASGPPPDASGGVGDLLDLGSFAAPAVATPSDNISSGNFLSGSGNNKSPMQNQGNAISTAFDDLLGMDSSAPAATTTSMTSNMTPTTNMLGADMTANTSLVMAPKSGGGIGNSISNTSENVNTMGQAWVRANIKTSHASGSPVVDWSKVHLFFRLEQREANVTTGATSLVFRVENEMEMSALSNLTLRLKDYGDVSIGNVAPKSFAESTKYGPFTYPAADTALEMKGNMLTPGCNVPVKLVLPVTVHITPVNGLTLDQVGQELMSANQWASHSAKIEISPTDSPMKVKSTLCQFVSMVEIEPSGGAGTTNFTMAGRSAGGIQIRVLVKLKKDSLKADVKCTDPYFAKALCSDMKRLRIL